MANQLLLLTDAERFGELRKFGGLPGHLLADVGSDLATRPHPDAVIVRYSPDLLAPPDESAARGGGPTGGPPLAMLRDTLFARLLGSVVCHLVVLASEPGRPPEAHPAQPDVPREPMTLPRLISWYEHFRREAALRVDKRTPEYRHVLILVCTEDMPGDQLEALNHLVAGEGSDKLFDACYVMLRKLELGPSDVLHAHYAWPSYVGRLLLRLAGERIDNAPRTVAQAWRAFEIAPEVAPRLIEEQCYEGLTTAQRRLAQTVLDRPEWQVDHFQPVSPQLDKVELRDRFIAPPDFWQSFRARDATDETDRAAHWERELAAAGHAFGEQLTRAALGRDPGAWEEVEAVWRAVHSDPNQVASALADLRLVEGPPSGEHLAELARRWAAVQRVDHERARMLDDARCCADHLEAAQACFVQRAIRIVLAGVAAALVAWLAIATLRDLLGSWTIPLAACGACAVGAVAGALVPYLLERHRGERALAAFIGMLNGIDAKTKERHFVCQSVIESAHTFWQVIRAKGTAQRLRLLLERVQAMLSRELLPQPVDVVPSAGELSDGIPWAAEQADRFARVERALLLEGTAIPCPVGFDRHDLDRERLGEVVDRQIDEFKHSLWKEFCETDRRDAGHLPAHVLIPMLRDFCEGFRRAVKAETHRQASDKVRAEALRDLRERIIDVQSHTFSYYMSCVLPAAHSASARRRLLILRPSFRREGLDVPDTPVCGDGRPWAFLEGLAALGYYFEEVPVAFEVSPDGFIRVKRR